MKLDRSLIYILSFALSLLVGCSSSGGGGTPAASTDINIAGVWTIKETDKQSADCTEIRLDTFDLTVTQDGSNVTVTDADGNSFTGTLNDQTLSWTGSFAQDSPFSGTAGITTITQLTANIDESCNSLTGTSSWTWTATEGEPFTCSGTTTFIGDRDPPIGCGTTTTTGAATGIWEGTVTEDGASVPAIAVVQGDQIRVISEDAVSGTVGTIAASNGSFTASTTDYILFGPPTGTTTSLTGTYTAGSTLSGSFNSSDGSSGTFSFTYDPVTDKGSSLATTAGTWTSMNTLLQFTIDNAGAISGSASGCVFTGNVSILDAAVNIYGLSLTISSCPGTDGTYGGYAAVSDDFGGVNNVLNIIMHNANFLVADQLLR